MLEVNKIYRGDCLELVKRVPLIDFILTDPPYPNYYREEYQYRDGLLEFLNNYNCRQLIFWSARVEFPLDYTAVHIWNKKTGNNTTQYERIFERNGQKNYKIFSYYFINSTVAAKYNRDVFTGHKSQKPIGLIKELIEKFTKENDVILDPFIGSGTTAVACKLLDRNFIGIEINPDYVEIANKRLANTYRQMELIK